jgi:hypothetical protein
MTDHDSPPWEQIGYLAATIRQALDHLDDRDSLRARLVLREALRHLDLPAVFT